VPLLGGERNLTTDLLLKDAAFRLIVGGNISVTKMERFINQLEFDKEIPGDQNDDEEEDEAVN